MERTGEVRRQVAEFLRQAASEIEETGQSVNFDFAIFDHDLIDETVCECLESAANCDEAFESFVKAADAGRNVTLEAAMFSTPIKIQFVAEA